MPRYFAPGIPEKGRKSALPEFQNEPQIWDYSLQFHEADKAGPHYDLRLSDGAIAHSFAIRNGLPKTGQKHLAVRTEDHDPSYMNFSGVIEDGYGKGKVRVVESGKADVLKSTQDKISFNLYKGSQTEQYHLIRTSGDNWLIINNTPTRQSRPEIPAKKIKARNEPMSKLPLVLEDPNKVLTAKIDGAASVFVLKKDRAPEVFSYRKSKRGPELINRTPKYDKTLAKIKVPKTLDGTILWGEAFVTDQSGKALPQRITSGLLNSNVWNTRDELKKNHWKFDNAVYNIQTYKGKDVSKLPFSEKLNLLKQIQQEIPELKLTPMAENKEEKLRLYNQIMQNKHPLTHEGFVAWDKSDWKPSKFKKKQDTELYVQGYEPGKGKYFGSLGKIVATRDPKGVGPKIRVGGGYTDEMRRRIWESPEKYKGLPITVEYQHELPSGKLRMPIFKHFRVDEYWD